MQLTVNIVQETIITVGAIVIRNCGSSHPAYRSWLLSTSEASFSFLLFLELVV
jgi:hypothetical protein